MFRNTITNNIKSKFINKKYLFGKLNFSNQEGNLNDIQNNKKKSLSEKFLPIKNLDPRSLTKPSQLFFIKEFSEGFINLHLHKYKEAEDCLKIVKDKIRKTHISSYEYSIIIRRLALARLKQEKIKEGLIEMENFFEFSKRSLHNITYKYNALSDLLRIYIFYDSRKVKIYLIFILT